MSKNLFIKREKKRCAGLQQYKCATQVKPGRNTKAGIHLIACIISALVISSCSLPRNNFAIITPSDTEKEIIRKAAHIVPSPRQLRWQELELIAFFHFGINTFTNREWGTGKEDPFMFNPVQFDAKQWVRVAKEAGIKQVILTAKHHDGFCLWPTATTTHSVSNSSWKNGKGDIVKEVAEACRENGLGFGIYLSPWDMHAPEYGTDAYNDLFMVQLTELLIRYGRVDEVWFDGANGEGANGKKQVYDFDGWYKLIRQLQPEAVIAVMGPDVRWVGTETGYGRETEWSVVPAGNLDQAAIASGSQTEIAFKPQGDMTGSDLGSRQIIRQATGLVWYPAETDVSIRPGWFHHPEENDKVKSAEKLLDIYYHSVGRNGVLLLNIPPDKRGLIHENDIAQLQKWKGLIDETFARNLLKDAVAQSPNGKGLPGLWDNNTRTTFTTKRKDSATVIEFTLPNPVNFDVLLLQEDITRGQRVEEFVFEINENGEWKSLTAGTTIGYKRLLKFDPVTAQKLRLRITSSRLNPHIAEIGIYKQPSAGPNHKSNP